MQRAHFLGACLQRRSVAPRHMLVMPEAGTTAGCDRRPQSIRGGICIPGLSCDSVSAITFMVAMSTQWLGRAYGT